MLTKDDVKKVAQLARLELTEEELEIMPGQLSKVLDYIDQLKEVDTEGVIPTAQVTGLSDVWREDEIDEWPKSEVEAALNAAPEVYGRQIKVKKILEQE
jgi:aspartyl-tRNA(Asn)/glutamyl-tRNA(Gln) amidotransferase subunit C